jgi:hypothetical protein
METLDSVLRWQVLCIVLLALLALILVGTNILLVWLLWRRKAFAQFHYPLGPMSATATTGSSATYVLEDVSGGPVLMQAQATEKAPARSPARKPEPKSSPGILCPKCKVLMGADHLAVENKVSHMIYKCPTCGMETRGPVP